MYLVLVKMVSDLGICPLNRGFLVVGVDGLERPASSLGELTVVSPANS